MKKAKLIIITVLVIIILVVILQNTESVETRILFITITMPRAILLLGTALLGFALGVIFTFFIGKKSTSKG